MDVLCLNDEDKSQTRKSKCEKKRLISGFRRLFLSFSSLVLPDSQIEGERKKRKREGKCNQGMETKK